MASARIVSYGERLLMTIDKLFFKRSALTGDIGSAHDVLTKLLKQYQKVIYDDFNAQIGILIMNWRSSEAA